MRRSGFTLIELIAVVTIFSIMLLAIVPALDSTAPKYRLRSAARQVASLIEEGQSTTIYTRREHSLIYELDRGTYTLLVPPIPPEEQEEEQGGLGGLGGLFGGDDEGGEKGPIDDIEHGLPPQDPEEATDEDRDSEELEPMELPYDVEFFFVRAGDDTTRSGRAVVPLSRLGTTGSHVVGVRLKADQDRALYIKFNALTRTISYSEEEPEVRTIDGE